MDSRFLNPFCDDIYEGTHITYGNDIEYWSSNNDALGLQLLTETLNGILPIPPTENFQTDDNTNFSIHSYKCDDISEGHFMGDGAIEIMTIDPNADGYDTDNEDNVDDCADNEENSISIEYDRQSQCSNVTFKTRTDSSSIGDYESHTSDYDDVDDEIINKSNPTDSFIEFQKVVSPLIETPFKLPIKRELSGGGQQRSVSENSTATDIGDGLDLIIDANHFDLAEFITQDDIILSPPLMNNGGKTIPQEIESPSNLYSNAIVISSKNSASDTDSDVIVDVETVEMEAGDDSNKVVSATQLLPITCDVVSEAEDDNNDCFVDNVETDPSWSPPKMNKKPDISISEKLINSNTGKQCDLVKSKMGRKKGNKAIPKTLHGTKKIPNTNNAERTEQINREIDANKVNKHEKSRKTKEGKALENKLEGGERRSVSPNNKTTNTQLVEISGRLSAQHLQPVKRKLNLDEYKKRRCDPLLSKPTVHDKAMAAQNRNSIKTGQNMSPHKHSEEVTSIVKSLKEQQQQQQTAKTAAIDPITIAKNKVLRMQELKKAQQLRIIDSTISAKVPKVTKLPPLREIVKDSVYLKESDTQKQSDESLVLKTDCEYEEISIVSIKCNTNISIPPLPERSGAVVSNATRSLLKSTALLSTVSNTFEKVKAVDSVKIGTSSLIASIQDVVVRKAVDETNRSVMEMRANEKGPDTEHHGENKIIMHLRKDRIRPTTSSTGVQTDLLPQFPPLPLPKLSVKCKSHENRKRRSYRKTRTACDSDQFTTEAEQSDSSQQSSLILQQEMPHRSRDGSYSSSLERMRAYDSAIGTGGYSSHSSHRHRSSISSSYSESVDRTSRRERRQRRTSYKQRNRKHSHSHSPDLSSSDSSDYEHSHNPTYVKRSRSRSNSRNRKRNTYKTKPNSNYNNDRNISQPAVEERRIVYVGRIEQKTTKDMLRMKFSPYGVIKQISIHYKENGMKYGFVTYERAQDAFAAIDNSTRDPQINMYDVSFGGRRAFCGATYADLDNAGINTYHSYVFPQNPTKPKEEDTFEALLMKMKAKLNANKSSTSHNKGHKI